jgi:helix-turn-helix protein
MNFPRMQQIFADTTITNPTDRFVLVTLAYHDNPKGECYPSAELLAGYDRRSVFRTLKRLEDNKHIKKLPGGGRGHSNRYQLTLETVTVSHPLSNKETVTVSPETVTLNPGNGDPMSLNSDPGSPEVVRKYKGNAINPYTDSETTKKTDGEPAASALGASASLASTNGKLTIHESWLSKAKASGKYAEIDIDAAARKFLEYHARKGATELTLPMFFGWLNREKPEKADSAKPTKKKAAAKKPKEKKKVAKLNGLTPEIRKYLRGITQLYDQRLKDELCSMFKISYDDARFVIYEGLETGALKNASELTKYGLEYNGGIQYVGAEEARRIKDAWETDAPERERLAKEKAERLAAERAAEEACRVEAERIAAEQQREANRLAAERLADELKACQAKKAAQEQACIRRWAINKARREAKKAGNVLPEDFELTAEEMADAVKAWEVFSRVPVGADSMWGCDG